MTQLKHFEETALQLRLISAMGLLPDTKKLRLRMHWECRERFPATTGKRSRHASRNMCDARAVMYAGIAN